MKKQKQTRERPIRGRSATSSHNKNNKIPVSSIFLPRIIVMIFNIAKDCTERLSAVRASEKNRESNVTDWQCLSATCFTNNDISASCFTSLFRAHDLLKSQILIPSKKTRFSPQTWALRESYFPIRKIKLSQKLRATRSLSIGFITSRVFFVQLAFTIWVKQQGYFQI